MKLTAISLLRALQDLVRPKIMAVMAVPFLGSFAIWSLVTWAFWDWITGLGYQFYQWPLIQKLVELLSPYFVLSDDPITAVIAGAFILILILPAALVTALFIASLILVPIIVKDLREREYPQLTPKNNSIFAGIGPSIGYSFKYFITWVVSLPLWVLIPAGALIIPFLLVAWFNSRLFAWEVMTEIASQQEIQPFLEKHSKDLFILGLITTLFYYIPIVNIIAPVITSAAYARFCLKSYVTDTGITLNPLTNIKKI